MNLKNAAKTSWITQRRENVWDGKSAMSHRDIGRAERYVGALPHRFRHVGEMLIYIIITNTFFYADLGYKWSTK